MSGRNKQPVDVLTARGKSHLTKAEKERRKATESVVPVALRGVSPPGYLDKWPEIRDEFNRYAEMLTALMPDNFGQPDADCLARYVVSEALYLEMHRPILFNELVLSDKLFEHCAEIEEAARNRMELIVPELAKQYGVTEQLKAENQMEWVRQMNACKAQAEEVVKAELIYN